MRFPFRKKSPANWQQWKTASRASAVAFSSYNFRVIFELRMLNLVYIQGNRARCRFKADEVSFVPCDFRPVVSFHLRLPLPDVLIYRCPSRNQSIITIIYTKKRINWKWTFLFENFIYYTKMFLVFVISPQIFFSILKI